MKEFLKKWIIPPGYLNLKYNISINKNKILHPENKHLKDKYNNVERCFILATGPSINNMDLRYLKDEFCISVSCFYLHKDFKLINPYFHCYAPSHPPLTEEQLLEGFNQYKNNSQSNTTKTVMVDYDSKLCLKNNILENKNIIEYSKGGIYPIDFTKKLPSINTVVHVAIYLAMYLRIKNIYLLGVDHNFIEIFKKSSNMHFYKEHMNKMTDKKYDAWGDFTGYLGDYCYSIYLLWEVYKKIKKEAEANNINIINATENSFLDLFLKVEYNNLF